MRPPGRDVAAIAAAVCVLTATVAYAQFGRGGFFGFGAGRIATQQDFDGRFHYCRIVYRQSPDGRDGSWRTDYPRADINFSIRFSELTKANVAFNAQREPNHLLVNLGGPELFGCPVVILSAPGAVSINDAEALNLRTYLLKGGFLWVDDFWGTEAWNQWTQEIGKVLPPEEYPIEDISAADPIMREMFDLEKIPQITNVTFWVKNNGKTSEREEDSAVVHVRAIRDRHRRIMVLMTHNTDVGDSFEREREDSEYSRLFSPPGYALGINVLLYAMTQ